MAMEVPVSDIPVNKVVGLFYGTYGYVNFLETPWRWMTAHVAFNTNSCITKQILAEGNMLLWRDRLEWVNPPRFMFKFYLFWQLLVSFIEVPFNYDDYTIGSGRINLLGEKSPIKSTLPSYRVTMLLPLQTSWSCHLKYRNVARFYKLMRVVNGSYSCHSALMYAMSGGGG